jgi:ornithine cyclodeaminase
LEETGLFVELDMLADPDEPRDLYGMLIRCEKALKQAA